MDSQRIFIQGLLVVLLATFCFAEIGDMELTANLSLTSDEKKIFWFNGNNWWSERANSALVTNIDWTKPANAGTAGNPLVTDGTNTMSWGGDLVIDSIKVDDGNVSTPSYSFTDDTDTGIYATEDGGGGQNINFAIDGVRSFIIDTSIFNFKDSASTNFARLQFSNTAMTQDRDFIWDLNDGDRTFDISGNFTVESTSVINSDLSTDAAWETSSSITGGSLVTAGDCTAGTFNTLFTLVSNIPGNWSISDGTSVFNVEAGSVINSDLSTDADWATSGSITGGSLVTGGDIGISGDTDLLQLAANALTVNGTVTATGAGNFAGLTLNLAQDYLFTDSSVRLVIQGQTVGQTTEIFVMPQAIDGTDDCTISIFSKADGIADLTNFESLRIGYDVAFGALNNIYVIHSQEAGTGNLLPIHIFADGAATADQLVLNIDGTVDMANAVTVGSLITGGNIGVAADTDLLVLTNDQLQVNGNVDLTNSATVFDYGDAGGADSLEFKGNGTVINTISFTNAAATNSLVIQLTGNIATFTVEDNFNLGSTNESIAFTATTAGKKITFTSPTIIFNASTSTTIGAGTAGVDYILTFDGENNDGVLTWMEDEDRLDIADAVKVTGLHWAITTKTDTDYTLTINDDMVLFDTGATTRTATLPAAATVTGKVYHIKKIDAGAGFVTIDGNASETIDGDLTPDITAQYESFSIISDGSNWHVF